MRTSHKAKDERRANFGSWAVQTLLLQQCWPGARRSAALQLGWQRSHLKRPPKTLLEMLSLLPVKNSSSTGGRANPAVCFNIAALVVHFPALIPALYRGYKRANTWQSRAAAYPQELHEVLHCPSMRREQGPEKAPLEPLFLLLGLVLVASGKCGLAELKVDYGSACVERRSCTLPPWCIDSCILEGI